MRLVIALLLTLFLTGCRWESDTYCDPSLKNLPARPDDETMYYQHELCKVINEYATELEWYHQVWLEHSYAKRDDDGQFIVWVDFTSQANEDIPNARRLSVRVIDGLIDKLNESEILRNAQPGPFTFEHIYFSLEYKSFYGKYNDSLLVGRSELKYGYLNVFYAHDAFQVEPIVYHKHTEPYEISRCIVATQDETHKRLKPTGESIFDRMVSPEDWMSGDPEYVRKPPEEFKSYEYDYRSTLSNYPKYAETLPSGEIKTSDEKSTSSNRR
ncbi:MAG: hypothetical protein K940chlam3_00060 [Chlamydiae bacterium]|nr:hypothetical protein [Chlamydiota bacterium]